MITCHIEIDRELWDQLAREAAKSRIHIADLVNRILRAGLKEKRKRDRKGKDHFEGDSVSSLDTY